MTPNEQNTKSFCFSFFLLRQYLVDELRIYTKFNREKQGILAQVESTVRYFMWVSDGERKRATKTRKDRERDRVRERENGRENGGKEDERNNRSNWFHLFNLCPFWNYSLYLVHRLYGHICPRNHSAFTQKRTFVQNNNYFLLYIVEWQTTYKYHTNDSSNNNGLSKVSPIWPCRIY